mgnify:FL=1
MPTCYQSIIVSAPIEKVWDKVRNFHDMSWADQVITQCDAVGNVSATDVGAKRILNNAFHETLLECNDDEYRVRYSIDDGPSPVSAEEVKNYIGQIQLKPVTLSNETFVEWESTWESRSEEAREFCHQIYVALLQSLAQQSY